MSKSELQKWAEEKGESVGFESEKNIYQANYYETGQVRNVILAGTFRGEPAVLKAYDDPRTTDEPELLKEFHRINKSDRLTAPRLHEYEMVTPEQGWFIMEMLPKEAVPFRSPLPREERNNFLEAFREYRRNFPSTPTRELTLEEKLSAPEYHDHRINTWLKLASNKEQEEYWAGRGKVLDMEDFLPRYQKGMQALRRVFQEREMVWCHGHVKPKEIFQVPGENIMYLTDFAHAKMYPEGYELAFIIWADHIMEADWQRDYSEWRQGIFDWIEDIKPVAEELGIKDFDNFFPYCLLERVLGTILADVCASNKPRQEKEKRLDLLFQLFDELMA